VSGMGAWDSNATMCIQCIVNNEYNTIVKNCSVILKQYNLHVMHFILEDEFTFD